MKMSKTSFLTQAALIAAVYVVVTIMGAAHSFGQVQVRLSEMLTILPFFTPAAIPGLFVGCIIGNLAGGGVPLDIIFGSLATLIGTLGTWKLRNYNIIFAAIPPIVANAIIVPFILKYAYGLPFSIPFMMLMVGIGEVISCGVLGVLFGKVLEKYRYTIFRTDCRQKN